MNLSYVRQNKECWNCNKPYDVVYRDPDTKQIVMVCNSCGSQHGIPKSQDDYFKK